MRKNVLLPFLTLAGLLFCPLVAHAFPNIYEVHVLFQVTRTSPTPLAPASANLDGRFTYDSVTNTSSNVLLLLTNTVVDGVSLAGVTLTSLVVTDNFIAPNTRTLQFSDVGGTRSALVTFDNPPGLPVGGSSISVNPRGTVFFAPPAMNGVRTISTSSGTITSAPEIDGASTCLPLAWAAMGLALLSDRRRRRRFA